MADSHQQDLAAFLFEHMRAHDVEAKLAGDVVELPATAMRVSGAIVSENTFDTHASVQLDVRFEIGPGRTIIESCGGLGATLDDAIANAKEGFVRNALHVLLAAFCGVETEQVTVETWTIGGEAVRVVIGGVTGRGTPPQGRMPLDWFAIVEAALCEAPLSLRTHWLRVYCARMPGGDHITEALLDGEPWASLADRLAAYAWPPSEDFYSARVFLVLDRGFDTSRAVAAFDRLRDRPDTEIVAALVALGAEQRHAEKLVDFLPVAFGRPVLEKLGVQTSDEAVLHEGGSERTIRLLDDPIFADAAALAQEAYTYGTIDADLYRALAMRSAELDAVNQALNGGAEAADLALSAPVFSWA